MVIAMICKKFANEQGVRHNKVGHDAVLQQVDVVEVMSSMTSVAAQVGVVLC